MNCVGCGKSVSPGEWSAVKQLAESLDDECYNDVVNLLTANSDDIPDELPPTCRECFDSAVFNAKEYGRG
jgi:hypothetical protein